MAAEAPVTEETRKRGMGKLLFLAVNVLLFVAGAGFFVLTKFGVLGAAPSPQAPRQRAAACRRASAHRNATTSPARHHGAL
ncbi:MAG: hypothetical protein KatS3mg131_1270 [Candidatus Tectimicrobiota bacterium]|nr:MAG: hypothetical protein KatS3mg131_1270 [Candidatus Tectomicrobia bacterium]